MKKLFLAFLLTGALLPLACGKNLSPTAQNVMVEFPTATFTPSALGWDIAGPATLSSGQFSYRYIHVLSGGFLLINGAVTLELSSYFMVDAGGVVDGNGSGYGTCQGPGAPVNCGSSNAGGGHGGPGGIDGSVDSGGVTYDDPLAPAFMGSGGGHTGSDSGGALLKVNIPSGGVTVNGNISMDGGAGSAGGSGGGAGGTLFIHADVVSGSGNLEAKGGAGQNAGGGGGGGIVLLSVHSGDFFGGTVSVDGGAGSGGASTGGGAGDFNVTNF